MDRSRKSSSELTIVKGEHDRDVQCGVGACRPRWLQKLANRYVFLLFFAFMEIMQATFYSYFRSVISTLERQFAVQSQTIGLVLAGKEISQILCGLLLAYYGGRGNRPRWIACGMLIIAFACLVMVSPIFLYLGDPALQLIHQPEGGGRKGLCAAANDTWSSRWSNATSPLNGTALGHECDAVSVDTLSALVLLFVGGFIAGTGIIMLVTLSYPYLDDNSTKSSSALYIAIVTGLQVTGPTVGSILGGLCLRFYVTLSNNPGITEDDPKWIGAWWLGFVIIGIAFALGSIVIVFFPRQLSSNKKEESQEDEAVNEKDIANNNKRKSPKITGFPTAIKRLLTNKILICHGLARCFILFGTNGHETFQPKYIESYFHQTASDSSFFTGISGNAMRIVGILILGVVLRFWKPKAIYVTAWNIILDFIYIGSLIALMLINCPTLEIIGFSTGPANTIQMNDQLTCSSNCTGGCTNAKFTPICLENKNYFSPCHAGCTHSQGNNRKNRVYSNCSCASSDFALLADEPIFNDSQLAYSYYKYEHNSTTKHTRTEAKAGYCPFSCSSFTIYLIVMGIMRTLMATRKISRMLIILRCIDERDKSLGIALHTLMESVFAYIPCPIIYGALLDAACIMWGNNCGHRGNCWLYDSDYLRYVMQGLTLLMITCGTAMDGYVLYLCRALNLFEDKKTPPDNAIEASEKNTKSTSDEMEITAC